MNRPKFDPEFSKADTPAFPFRRLPEPQPPEDLTYMNKPKRDKKISAPPVTITFNQEALADQIRGLVEESLDAVLGSEVQEALRGAHDKLGAHLSASLRSAGWFEKLLRKIVAESLPALPTLQTNQAKVLSVICRTCNAEVGRHCNSPTGSNPISGFHKARLDDASIVDMTENPRPNFLAVACPGCHAVPQDKCYSAGGGKWLEEPHPERKAAYHQLFLSIVCPSCDVPVGRPCIDVQAGVATMFPHQRRVMAASAPAPAIAPQPYIPPAEWGVHEEHCCIDHGCKYAKDHCPVETGKRKQAHPCEKCDDETLEGQKIVIMAESWKRDCPTCRAPIGSPCLGAYTGLPVANVHKRRMG